MLLAFCPTSNSLFFNRSSNLLELELNSFGLLESGLSQVQTGLILAKLSSNSLLKLNSSSSLLIFLSSQVQIGNTLFDYSTTDDQLSY